MKKSTIQIGLKGALILGGLCAIIPSVYGQGIGLKKLDEMMVSTPQKIARGKVIYQRQCASCHGADGKNDVAPYREQFPDMVEGGFASGQFKRGGGLVQIYNIISKPQPGVSHPVIDGYVPFQDRWAAAHYVKSLSPTKHSDPVQLIEEAKFEAVNGVCREELKSSIADRVKPQGDEQMKKGAEVYALNCVSCHGEQGAGDGAAAAALQPAPRNFTDKGVKWTNGSSPLAIFKTLANGIEGTSMAAYSNLSEDERWALTHYVRNWVPEEARQDSTEEQIVEVCRSLSAPAKPNPISIDLAMKFVVEDAPLKRAMELKTYGSIYQYADANAARGRDLYDSSCAGCHGADGNGQISKKPYGASPPFLYMKVDKLAPETAGGTYDAFARRAIGGVHATLPDMTDAATFSARDWKDLQGYVASFPSETKQFAPVPDPNQPAKASISEDMIVTPQAPRFAEASATLEEIMALDALAELIIANPALTKVQIEVHVSKDKTPDAGQAIKLSTDRAKVVREYLVSKGVQEERIMAKGFGFSQPKNNISVERVEFKIIERAPAPAPEAPSGTPGTTTP